MQISVLGHGLLRPRGGLLVRLDGGDDRPQGLPERLVLLFHFLEPSRVDVRLRLRCLPNVACSVPAAEHLEDVVRRRLTSAISSQSRHRFLGRVPVEGHHVLGVLGNQSRSARFVARLFLRLLVGGRRLRCRPGLEDRFLHPTTSKPGRTRRSNDLLGMLGRTLVQNLQDFLGVYFQLAVLARRGYIDNLKLGGRALVASFEHILLVDVG